MKPDCIEEEWREINGYSGAYKVSKTGLQVEGGEKMGRLTFIDFFAGI